MGGRLFHPRREGGDRVQGIAHSFVFLKHLRDVVDDEQNRIAKEVGSRTRTSSS